MAIMDHYCGHVVVRDRYATVLALLLLGIIWDFGTQPATDWALMRRMILIVLFLSHIWMAIDGLFEVEEVEDFWGTFFRHNFQEWRENRAVKELREPDEARPLSRAEKRNIPRRAVQKLPVLVYFTTEELSALNEEELKRLVLKTGDNRGAAAAPSLSRQNMAKSIRHREGSTPKDCTICGQAYVKGEELRMLSCGHALHGACLVNWSVGRLEDSKPAVCPICHAEFRIKRGM